MVLRPRIANLFAMWYMSYEGCEEDNHFRDGQLAGVEFGP
jgi:hypothetical protein